MSKVLTIRVRLQALAKIDRRAAELGQDRSDYVRSLIDKDLQGAPEPRKHVFASEDLAGCIRTGIRSSDNVTVRKVITERMRARYDKHR